MALGIPAVMVREDDGSYIYEDSFVMMHFMVATAIATAGLHISDTNKMYPIFVRVTRSGQILEEKLRKSIDEIDRYIVFQKYDKIKFRLADYLKETDFMKNEYTPTIDFKRDLVFTEQVKIRGHEFEKKYVNMAKPLKIDISIKID
jgi:hypothetical protein